ncbi:MAG: cereblon family protein [Actinomycetota bacterium]
MGVDVAADVVSDEDLAVQRDDVRCERCSAVVAHRSAAVVRAGRHVHTFRNPAGWSWTVRCFRDAPGCRSEGELTTDATWFPGHAWCFARCTSCGQHLGWWYVGASSFVGLIANRVT